jgi:hypothetical protein
MLVTTLSFPIQTPRLQPVACHLKDRVILPLDFLLGASNYKKQEGAWKPHIRILAVHSNSQVAEENN